MAKKILITGGAGFIGSHLCYKYIQAGYSVVCVDNLQTTHSLRNVKDLLKHPRFVFIKHDIVKPLKRLKRFRFDWIFNLACSGSYTSYQYDPVHTMKTSTIGASRMLDLARWHEARILQASTSEIYGDPRESPQAETYHGNVNPIGPRACYDEGKRSAETLFMDYHREYGVDIRIVRIFNTYGPKMDTNDGRVITNFITNALSGKNLVIYGDGLQTRSFQYIDDLVDGLDRLMRRENFTGPVNIGNPGELTMLDLAKLIIARTGSSSRIIHDRGATDDPKRRCPDISLAKRVLGWEPRVSLASGLDKTIAYFRGLKQVDQRILVFTTDYYPNQGPAEKIIMDMSTALPATELHVITARFDKRLPKMEKYGTDTIFRVGPGWRFDKYFLPVLGFLKARRLHKENEYRFVWSVMASYGGLAASLFKLLNRRANFILTIDEAEITSRSWLKTRIIKPIVNFILSRTDMIYLPDSPAGESARQKSLRNGKITAAISLDTEEFIDSVRATYAEMISRQDRKLLRPK